ncbi:MAG: hypothetical protein IJG64_00375 [Oscillospiraceae bacterium]|nr:hypothetical protein [Oscillospiraceae bacterium]
MFALVALLCLYLGINNVRNAFRLASENGWQRISVLLIITGIILLALVIPCVIQATKDLREAKRIKEDLDRKEALEKKAKHDQFFYDDEDGFSSGQEKAGDELRPDEQ